MTKKRTHAFINVLMGLLGLWAGCLFFNFLTDDAFIAFRYVSNSQLGYGYVWNAPPFLPVEGYTSFLWVALLDLIWRVFNLQPPDVANGLARAFSYGVLWIGVRILSEICWREELKKEKQWFISFFLVFIVLNRTFLAWSSCGLETAMVTFLICLWFYQWVCVKPSLKNFSLCSLWAALLALSRPDGLLYCLATLFLILILQQKIVHQKQGQLRLLISIFPFSFVFGHLIWRHRFYGELIPNTYYAKVVSTWPMSGLRYIALFTIEYGWWLLIFPLVGLGMMWGRSIRKDSDRAKHLLFNHTFMIRVTVVGCILFQAAYYSFVVGGDHFGFRIFSHFIPLGFLFFVWSLNQLPIKRSLALIGCLLLIGTSLPLPLTHLYQSTRAGESRLFIPIKDAFPSAFHPLVGTYDSLQCWLNDHLVCVRWHTHRAISAKHQALCPSREEGFKIPANKFPVLAADGIGVEAWRLPTVNIIDMLGLNDYVIARNRVSPKKHRRMAHDRFAPAGYVKAFRPNVKLDGGQAFVYDRVIPLSAEEIIRTEQQWRDHIKFQ